MTNAGERSEGSDEVRRLFPTQGLPKSAIKTAEMGCQAHNQSLCSTDLGFSFLLLAMEKSPYLLQHTYNPVDWFP
ncbi:DUF255 domain-containing protein [Paenibacillus alginolyticus]|uniref:DUF255 domain-containing protein n=1 Tax=Paenibacillus alginolyticus TaxID=59839 RepID=UPI000FDC9784|nr:DUF255 domain-containing protein [Paenibacillus alginolyticus]MCY9664600.1 DUF255 domain-containing protein [Paenibacillus alginolyticus]